MSISSVGQHSCLSRFNGYVKFSTTVLNVLWQITQCAANAFDFLAQAFTSLASMPILRSFMEACGKQIFAISVVLDGIHKAYKIKKNAASLQRNLQKLDRWSKSSELFNELKQGVMTQEVFEKADRQKNSTLTLRQQDKQGVLMRACQKVSEERKVPFKNAVEAFINVKNDKLNVKIHNLKVNRVKHQLSLAHDIGQVAVIIAALAVTVGIVMAGSSPLPLLFLAFVTSSIALGKETYGAFHKKSRKAPEHVGIQVDIVHQYKILKEREIKAKV